VTRIRDKIEPNAFQRLIEAVQAADEKRIEDEATRISRRAIANFKPAIPRRSAQRTPTR
jgi:hypothetical protein